MSNSKRTKAKFIDDVQVTSDCLTSRAGLNLFARYLHGIALFPHFNRLLGPMRYNSVSTHIDELFKQDLRLLKLICCRKMVTTTYQTHSAAC